MITREMREKSDPRKKNGEKWNVTDLIFKKEKKKQTQNYYLGIKKIKIRRKMSYNRKKNKEV